MPHQILHWSSNDGCFHYGNSFLYFLSIDHVSEHGLVFLARVFRIAERDFDICMSSSRLNVNDGWETKGCDIRALPIPSILAIACNPRI